MRHHQEIRDNIELHTRPAADSINLAIGLAFVIGEVERFLEDIEQATDVASVKNALETSVSALGFQKYLYLSVDFLFTRSERPTTFSNYPRAWLDQYIGEQRYLLDPNLRVALQNILPFDWRDLRRSRNLTSKDQEFLDEAASHGLVDGITVPLHGPGPVRAFLNFATDKQHALSEPGHASDKHAAHLVAIQLHSVLRRLLGVQPEESRAPELTSRELECLLWAARGKTSWETAAIIEISESTVNFHLTNAMKKLGVFSRAHAVAKAVALSLLYV